MTCRACGTQNRVGAKFCVECGAALGAACPSCGSPVDANAKFCPECGTRLTPAGGPATPQAQPSTVAGATGAAAAATERRVVSVLFADLVGFTTIAEGRDSEVVRDLLSRYFERASEVVTRYGGTVEKFIGDAVMAVWGTPVAHEDDAERSVRAALDLVDAVRTLGREAGVADLQARAGILTGEAAVAIGAQNQGMVAGDLVNTASRLQSAAEPGTVLVGDATRQAAEGAIAFEPIGDQTLKGKSTPVPAYRALRVVATVRGTIRTEALEPPFVGRETEFRLLRELFHATGRERRARLVSLTGQAGIGKSRLAWEFEKYLDGIAEPVWWHRGRSPAYGDGVTFWSLGEMIRKRAGLAEGDDEETSRARLTAAIAEHVPSEEERAFVEPALLALLGLGDAPAGGRDRLFAGWRLFLERLSEKATVALVFEDVHWADDGLLDFIDHLLDWSRSYPIYVLTLARPELLDRRPTWGAGGRSASSLALGPLDDGEMRELINGLVHGLSEPATRAILDRADGIPLYAVETVRMLLADGRLEATGDGTYRPTGRLADLEVPATLQALIAARLDALDAADRALLQHASVLGKTFSVEALAAVSGQVEAEVVGRLRSLVARELLELDTDPASPERGQYGFVQALIREVAYSTLARRERRVRHLAAARYFEARGEEELAPVLASHYLDAYRAAPEGPEGQALRTQARIALRAAADRAMALGSYRSVVTAIESSLELGGGEPEEDADLHERAGTAADIDGQYERARAHLTKAVEGWGSLGDQRRLGGAAAGLALTLSNAGHSSDARRVLDHVAAELADVPDASEARAPVLARIAQIHIRVGEGQPALDIIDDVLAVAERLGQHRVLIDALITKGSALGLIGRVVEGTILTDGAVRLAAERGEVDLELRGLGNGAILRIESDPRRSFELGLQAIEQSRRFGVQPALIYAVGNTCEIAFYLGDWETAEELLRSALAREMDVVDRMVLLGRRGIMALLRGRTDDEDLAEFLRATDAATEGLLGYLRGDLEMVRDYLEGRYAELHRNAIELARGDDQNATLLYEVAARAALWGGDVEALKVTRQEFRALGRVGGYPHAQMAAIDAGVLALTGHDAEAAATYDAAIRELDGLRLGYTAAMTRLDALQVLGGDHRDAGRWSAEARTTFERLGTQPLLDRLDAVAPGTTTATRPAAMHRSDRSTEATPA